MIKLLIAYTLMVAIDAVWLTVIAKPLFAKYLGAMMRQHTYTIPAALAAWLLLCTGLQLLVVPRVPVGNLLYAFLWGAFFGVCVYGVYELTNYAVLASWPVQIVVVDTLWGGFLCGIITLFLCW